MAGFVVLLADEPKSVEQQLRAFAERNTLSRVSLTVFNGAAGPENYAIGGAATVTVMRWGGEKKLVSANYSVGNEKLDDVFIAKVVADVSEDNHHDGAVRVGVFNMRITIERLKQIGTMTNVEVLDLQDVNLTASGLNHLERLTKLRSLNLFRNKRLTDSAMDTLVKFSQLEELNISSTQITNAGLGRLVGELTHLKKLNFRNTRTINDAGLKRLLQRPKLEVLLCGNTFITDVGLAHIGELSALQELEVRKTKITDNGLVHLAKLTNLRKLNCSDNNITNDGVRHLSGLTGLQSLDLSQARINDAGIASLKELTELNRLDLSKTRITGAGLRHVHRLRNLKFLNLFATQANDRDVVELQRALPNCDILH